MQEQAVASSDKEGPGRRQQLVELTVFLFLVVPSLAVPMAGVVAPRELSFTPVAVANMLRDLALMSLVLYFGWSSGEGLSRLGLRSSGTVQEMLIGVLLFVPFYGVVVAVQLVLGSAGFSTPEQPPPFLIPSSGAEYALAMPFLLVVAVSEEIIFRGYLIRRFTALTGNKSGAVLLAAVVFALGHGYQGTGGVLAVGLLGIVFGWIYLWRGSLVAPMVIHFMQDFIGLIVAPLYA